MVQKVVGLNPDRLPEYLAKYTGCPAIVKSVDPMRKSAVIVFENDIRYEVDLDILIMLKRQSDIVMKLVRNWNIPTDDFQSVTKVSNLIHKGAFSDAMALALSNDVLRKYCTVNCAEWIKKQKWKISKKRSQ